MLIINFSSLIDEQELSIHMHRSQLCGKQFLNIEVVSILHALTSFSCAMQG